MKKSILIFGACLCLFAIGCNEITDNKINKDYKISVKSNGISQTAATVMFVFDNGQDSVINSDENGIVILKTDKAVKIVVGMKLGFSGIKEQIGDEENIGINLKNVDIPINEHDWIGTFGVYSTNSDGDVTFRYQGTFINYYCTSYLPYLGETTNPNLWGGWPLTEFTLPWKGKKLLVPRRYQTYHRVVYGFSLSQALFLRSNI